MKLRYLKPLRPFLLLLQGGFSNGYFLYSNDTFDINKQGVVSLRKDVTLDREKTDSYILQVQTCITLHNVIPFPVSWLLPVSIKSFTYVQFSGRVASKNTHQFTPGQNKTLSDTYAPICCIFWYWQPLQLCTNVIMCLFLVVKMVCMVHMAKIWSYYCFINFRKFKFNLVKQFSANWRKKKQKTNSPIFLWAVIWIFSFFLS